MKLEIGKCYRTRDGRKVELYSHCENPMQVVVMIGSTAHKMRVEDLIAGPLGEPCCCTAEYCGPCPSYEIGPVHTVTRKEIVPGVYGKVSVLRSDGWWFALTDKGDQVAHVHMSRADLTAAIETLTAIKEAME